MIVLVNCPENDNFIYDGDSNTCFRMVSSVIAKWSPAAAECHNLHERAHLVVIESSTKYNALEHFIETYGKGINS